MCVLPKTFSRECLQLVMWLHVNCNELCFLPIKINKYTKTKCEMASKIVSYLFHSYHCLCVMGTLVLTTWCVYLYYLDEDVSRVAYKEFHTNADNIYPSLSLCFGDIFVNEKLEYYGVNKSTYTRFLKGDLPSSKSMSFIDYKNVTINLQDFLLGIHIAQESGQGENKPNLWYDNTKESRITSSWKPNYYVDQFSHYINILCKCLTVDVPYISNKPLDWIAVVMKKSVFPNGLRPISTSTGGFFSVQLSYPNQRLRYSNKIISWEVVHITESYGTAINVHGMEVMKRRNKIKEPCNKNWIQDDDIIKDKMTQKLNCTPPYWTTQDATQPPTCTRAQELKEFYHMEWGTQSVPCRRISKLSYNIVDYATRYYDDELGGNFSKNYFYVALHFSNSMFKQIELVRAFDVESLIGNAGGYIGLCVGYSLLQFPVLIRELYKKYRQLINVS